jgi:hypothetical protein
LYHAIHCMLKKYDILEKLTVAQLVKIYPAFCETRRFISRISTTALCYIRTILPTNPYSEAAKSTSLPRTLHSFVIISRSCKGNLTLKQLNPLPSHASSRVLLNYHYPVNEPLIWSKWNHFPPSYLSTTTLCPGAARSAVSCFTSKTVLPHSYIDYIRDMPICCGSVFSFILVSKLLEVVLFYKMA